MAMVGWPTMTTIMVMMMVMAVMRSIVVRLAISMPMIAMTIMGMRIQMVMMRQHPWAGKSHYGKHQ